MCLRMNVICYDSVRYAICHTALNRYTCSCYLRAYSYCSRPRRVHAIPAAATHNYVVIAPIILVGVGRGQ